MKTTRKQISRAYSEGVPESGGRAESFQREDMWQDQELRGFEMEDAPFSMPDDSTEIHDPTHPVTDSGIDATELYQQGF